MSSPHTCPRCGRPVRDRACSQIPCILAAARDRDRGGFTARESTYDRPKNLSATGGPITVR